MLESTVEVLDERTEHAWEQHLQRRILRLLMLHSSRGTVPLTGDST